MNNSLQLSSLLTDTIRMLCCNGVDYNDNLRIQCLLVVTADTDRVHVIEMSETCPVTETPGVGSSGLCDTEPEANDYKPQMDPHPMHDIPGHATVAYEKPCSSRGRGAAHRGIHTVKRRGSFPPVANRSVPRMRVKKPKVEMEEDPVILLDSPDNSGDYVEPKREADWAVTGDDFHSLPEMTDANYDGTGMPLVDHCPQFSDARGRRGHGKQFGSAAHTVTSSDGMNEQSTVGFNDSAQDEKPYYLNYEGEQLDDGGQSIFPSDVDAETELEELYNATDQPFLCPYGGCGRTFKYKYNLNVHQRKKHGGLYGSDQLVTYFCRIPGCGRTFYSRAALGRHQKLHH